MATQTSFRKVCEALKNEKFDDKQLEIITSLCNAKREKIRKRLTRNYRIGDEVNVKTHKKSLPEISGIITEIKRTRLVIDCENHGIRTVPVRDITGV